MDLGDFVANSRHRVDLGAGLAYVAEFVHGNTVFASPRLKH